MQFLLLITFHWVQCDFTLTLLHTNDAHARIEQSDINGGSCTPEDVAENDCYGGIARRYTKLKELRATHDNVLLLDGGDQFQGTLWFNYYSGNATKYFMNKLQYDAMVSTVSNYFLISSKIIAFHLYLRAYKYI